MIEIRETREFTGWIKKLHDPVGVAKIVTRIQRLAAGHSGDVARVGDGLSEMRIHFGPGYRVYFLQCGTHVIILLAGGDKSSQSRDIRRAKQIALELDL